MKLLSFCCYIAEIECALNSELFILLFIWNQLKLMGNEWVVVGRTLYGRRLKSFQIMFGREAAVHILLETAIG